MRDVPVVFLTAGRLLLRHWPALLALSFLGAAVRNGALWAAVELSDVQSQLGQACLVLAPLGYLLPVVAMLRICRRSLPTLGAVDALDVAAPTERRELRLADVAVSVLVPFLAVYTAYGLLDADILRFRNRAAAEDFFDGADGFGSTASRLGIYSLHVALLVVLGAWLVRWVLGRAERGLRLPWLVFVGALVELFYTVQLAGQLVVIRIEGLAWVEDRVAAQWLRDWYGALVDAVGPLADAVRVAFDTARDVTGSLDDVVVIPVSWLALGAVVLGFKLAELEEDEERPPASGLLRSLWADVRERFTPLVKGLRLLASAGLAPMLVFAIGFAVVTRLPALLDMAARAVIGPLEYTTWVAVGPYELALGFAVSLALTAPLLAAAVDWLVRARTAARSPGSPTTPAAR